MMLFLHMEVIPLFFFQAEDGIRDGHVTGVQKCALPIWPVMLGSLVTMTFMIFGYYSWQRYFLDLLGRDAVWVSGVIAALISLTLIAGNALVLPLSRVVRTRTAVLMGSIVVQAIAIVLCGLLRSEERRVGKEWGFGGGVGRCSENAGV